MGSVPRIAMLVVFACALAIGARPLGAAAAEAGAANGARSAGLSCTVFFDLAVAGVPAALAYDPADGRMWFTEQSSTAPAVAALQRGSNTIARWPTARSGDAAHSITTPGALAVGPAGTKWVASALIGRVGILDPATGSWSTADVAGSHPLGAIAPGPLGTMWVASPEESRVYELSSTGGVIRSIDLAAGGGPARDPYGIASGGGADQAVYVAERATGTVARIPAAGPLPLPLQRSVLTGAPKDLATDPLGNVWATMPALDRVARISAAGAVTEWSASPSSSPEGIVAGADGGMWVTLRNAAKIGRIEQTAGPAATLNEQIIDLPDSNPRPGPISATPDGQVFFGEVVRKLAFFNGSATGAVPLPPQVSIGVVDGPSPIVVGGEEVYSSETAVQVRASTDGVCIDTITVIATPCAGGPPATFTGAAPLTYRLPNGCWSVVVSAAGPGGTTTLSAVRTIVDDARFPDTAPPALVLPADIVTAATSPAGAFVTFVATATDAIDAQPAVTCAPASGSAFAPGVTTVRCEARDAAGNRAQGAFTITVTVPGPIVAVPPSLTVEATAPLTPVTWSATASSPLFPKIDVACTYGGTIQLSRASEATYGTFAAALLPVATPITCSAADPFGGRDARSFVLTVHAPEPTITAERVYASTGAAYGGEWTSADIAVRFTCASPATISCGPDTTFSASGADQGTTGRTEDSIHRTATVAVGGIDIDKIAPTMSAGATGLPAPGGRIAIVAHVSLAASDPLSGVASIAYAGRTRGYVDPGRTRLETTAHPTVAGSVHGPLATFDVTDEGETTIEYDAVDQVGNTVHGTFVVTVVHTIDTTTTVTDVRTLRDGRVQVTARVTFTFDAAQVVPAGRSIAFTSEGITLTASVGADGTAVGVLSGLASGVHAVTAAFPEQLPYLASAAATHAIAAQPTTFVIWGGNRGGVSVGETDVFWGAQWSKRIADKAAAQVASSFKGWASDATSASWSARTGNGKPPPAIARYVTVLITTAVEKDGSGLKGDVAGYAVLEVDDPARYAAAPGRDAAGTVRSVYLR